MMSSALSKRQQQKNEKQLHELLKVPGNNVCADCGTKNPSWASWSLGIFLCVRCAALHRKLGTHISKVKSISLDTWTNDQVDNMRRTGNLASNVTWNPDPAKNPVPLNAEESDSIMERYLRQKYEQGKFRRDSATRTASSPQREYLSPSTATGAGIVRQPSPSVDKSFTLSDFSKFKSKSPAPEPKASRVLGMNGSVDIIPPEWEAKVTKLKDMGFPDAKRSVQVLRSVNGNLEQAVEILIRVSGASSPVPPPKDKPVVKKTVPANSSPAPRQQSSNPFEALDNEQQQQLQNAPQQYTQQQQAPNPAAMSNPFNQQGFTGQGYAGTNPYPQFQQQPPQQQQLQLSQLSQQPQQFQPLQQQHVQQSQQFQQPQQLSQGQPQQQEQQQFWQNSANIPQQFGQTQQYQQAQTQQNTANPFLQSYTNPYASQHQQQQQFPQMPFQQQNVQQPNIQQPNVQQPNFQQPNFQQQNVQAQMQQYPQQYQDPNQFFLQQQQLQQQQFPYQQPQQQQQFPQQQSLYHQQTGRVDKNTIMALYNYPQFAPTPNQSQQPVPEAPQVQDPRAKVAAPASGSNNPFLMNSVVSQNRPPNGARHNSQESVDLGGWQSGRHSPDAFASLSANFHQ